MATIAIDTSLDVRVAVTDGDTVVTRACADRRAHVEQLTPLLAEALAEAGEPRVERVVVGVGPGPFTGLRVGIAAAQTLAWVHGAALVAVCSLDVLARQAAGLMNPAGEFSIATDARRGEWYHARYTRAAGRIGAPRVGPADVVPGPCFGPVATGVDHLDPVVLATAAFEHLPPQALYLRDPDAKVPTRRKSALVPGLVLPTGATRPNNTRPTSTRTGATGPGVIRFATPGDLPAIVALEEAFPANQRWGPAAWRAELEADNRRVRVAVGAPAPDAPAPDAPVLGVITVQVIGDVADLNRVIVAPDARRAGVGARLVAAGVADAEAAGAREMLLEVRHDNRPARALYARAGFTEIAGRPDYYGSGVDAVVLRRALRAAQNPAAHDPADGSGVDHE